jgi:la-related protein 6
MAAEKVTEVPDIQIDADEHELEQRRNKRDSLSSGNGSDSENEKLSLENKIRLIPRPPKQESYDSVSSNGEEDDVELTEELRVKIIEQAEYYFSDENLKRDGFLLKHVKRNKEGFVNLKLLASFKKMRSLSRDYRVIGEALKDSTKLVVNENGLKIRRANLLPKELLDQARVKNLVVSKMPDENPSMDYVIAAFPGHKDDVISVRVVKPGKKFPNDLQSHFSRHPELKDQIVAVVEFDSPESAAAAIKNVDKDSYKGMDVKLLELGPKQAKRMSNNSESAASDTPIDSDSGGFGKKTKKLAIVC